MSEYEGRTPTPGLSPSRPTRQVRKQPLLERIADIERPSIARKLRADVESFDLRKVKDHSDIARGYQTILELALFLGHDSDVRKQCNTLIKALEGYAHHRKEYMNVDFPKEFVNEVRTRFQSLETALLPLVADENKSKVRRVFKEILATMEGDDAE